MLDLLLRGAYGDVSDVTWAELQTFPFRDPGPMAATARIPTLAEVLALHRHYGGLLFLMMRFAPGGLAAIVTRALQPKGGRA